MWMDCVGEINMYLVGYGICCIVFARVALEFMDRERERQTLKKREIKTKRYRMRKKERKGYVKYNLHSA